MDIQRPKITIKDVVQGYVDLGVEGVKGFRGKLDIRPPYQREFVYKEEQREAVIQTVLKGYPLNVMYWANNGKDSFEVLDGQQRTISLCQYVSNGFRVTVDQKPMFFHNLTKQDQEKILNYTLDIYVCSGDEKKTCLVSNCQHIRRKTL